MARRVEGRDEKRSLRVELAVGDIEVLDEACRMFGLGKSELVRRLVRASVDVGPALSTEGMERVEVLAGQVRMVGRNLMQVLRAIHRGEAVGIAGSEPVWRGLQEMIAGLDAELTGLIERNGPVLRHRAGLVAVAMRPNSEAA